MGYLLKEALKTVCGVNQWSYAAFWKIGCQNPKLLVWEECYCEQPTYSGLPHVSGIKSPELAFDDWEACWASVEGRSSQLVQAGDNVHSLVNKLMMDNQVHVVGEGLVGRSAFTGNHQWILLENCRREAHPPEVLNEVCQQFSAGMQTVAVIPVLPHGVVQLGSSLAIMENMGFVNNVKTLVCQLGSVPGVLLSDHHVTKVDPPKIGVPICLGKSVCVDSSGRSMVTNSIRTSAGSCSQQSQSTQALAFAGETSYPQMRQTQDSLRSLGLTLQASNMDQSIFKSHMDHHEAKLFSAITPNLSSISQLEKGVTKAEVIPLNPEIWLNQHDSLYIPRSGIDQPPCFESPSAANGAHIRLMERQILTDAGLQDHLNSSLKASNGFMMTQLRTNRDLASTSHKDSVPIPLAEVSGLRNGVNSHTRAISQQCSLSDANRHVHNRISCPHIAESKHQNVDSSEIEVFSSEFAGRYTDHLVSGGFGLRNHNDTPDKCSQIELAVSKERTENDLFQALSIQLPQPDEHLSFNEHIPVLDYDNQNNGYGTQTPRLKGTKYEDSCVQPPSGDDLFDILGADFRSKLLNGSSNNHLKKGQEDANTQNLDNSPISMKYQGAGSDLYSVNEGYSDSGSFSVTGTDHLLDALVPKIHFAAKQSLDDNVSCRTTLTNLSSSSVPVASPSYGWAGLSNLMQGDLFGTPKSLAKVGQLSTSSIRSGSCKENAGNYSQSHSISGSQISSWVEQGHDMKQNGSVSTAYSKRPDEISKSNRKRLKPGENPRPRPKDRQMIQDRVKELREIVPNGAKCSIDALLERTIKHMLFLQSVSKHADKLRQTGEPKIISKEGGLLLKDSFDGGATWAYEVGSHSMVCPIIVEDLNPPRQMLVEMLCEERGLFLEIADIIRGLGLTILKGVMETRTDKIWARFAVEANRDVTRMEIFLSLVQLLEQTMKSGSAAAKGIVNDNVMIHQFHQAPSIPATGGPCSLR
ncbi:unnamed protein product [Ilex paraguariensis]|uniref:BHLH domain-containing protein n=1 Tax=Ilex paraguariensis TaxID=185542 RepID=A0ABC8UUC3_9AQUA